MMRVNVRFTNWIKICCRNSSILLFADESRCWHFLQLALGSYRAAHPLLPTCLLKSRCLMTYMFEHTAPFLLNVLQFSSIYIYIFHNCLCLHDCDTSLTEVFPIKWSVVVSPWLNWCHQNFVVSVMCVITIGKSLFLRLVTFCVYFFINDYLICVYYHCFLFPTSFMAYSSMTDQVVS